MYGTLSTRKKAWVIAVLTCLALLSVDALATERPALPAKPTGSEQAPDSVAFYHFMLGYQRELNNDAGEAEAEYLKALARDPTRWRSTFGWRRSIMPRARMTRLRPTPKPRWPETRRTSRPCTCRLAWPWPRAERSKPSNSTSGSWRSGPRKLRPIFPWRCCCQA